MASIDSILTWGVIGATVGSGIYLYKEGYLKDFLPDIGIGTPPPQVPPSPNQPTPAPGTSGTYTYWAKRKVQCRDNHLTFNYITTQNIRVLNWKLYNDGKIYAAVCGAPGPLTILVAIDSQDQGSATKLRDLGFTQYFAPPTDPNPSVPIPNPPTNSNLAMTMAYVGESAGHKAYKVYRHLR